MRRMLKPEARSSISEMPPPGRPLTSMMTGPSSVSLISVCKQPDVHAEGVRRRSSRRRVRRPASSAESALGVKYPVSRNGQRNGVRALIVACSTRPPSTTLSTETKFANPCPAEFSVSVGHVPFEHVVLGLQPLGLLERRQKLFE